MKLKLTAKKDFEAFNIWQCSTKIRKGDVYEGTQLETEKGFKMIVIVICGMATAYEVRVVKEYFEIEEVE